MSARPNTLARGGWPRPVADHVKLYLRILPAVLPQQQKPDTSRDGEHDKCTYAMLQFDNGRGGELPSVATWAPT